MKIRILCVAIAVLSCATLCACGGTNNAATTPTVDRSQITTTLPSVETQVPPVTAAPTTTTLPIEAPSGMLNYVSENHPELSIMLPASWDGCFTVRDSEAGIEFYELQNHLYDGSGLLFNIRFIDAASFSHDMFPDFQILAQTDTTYVIALFPTDVQTTEEYSVKYNEMMADVQSIIGTVMYTEPSATATPTTLAPAASGEGEAAPQ